MKQNWKYIVPIALLTLLAGLALGYVLFGGSGTNKKAAKTEQHDHGSTVEEYTCSMHPQIRQGEPGDCPICGMDLIPVEDDSGSGAANEMQLEMTPEAVKLAQVETFIVGGTSVENAKASDKRPAGEIVTTGRIKMDERLNSTQTAHVGGRIERLFVNFTGERVSKGQKLATIYSPELVTAQKELFEAMKLRAEIPALYESARQKLRQWKIADATIGRIEREGVVLTNIDVYADYSGVVMKKFVNVGDHVSEGSPMMELMNLNKLWVLFDLYERDLKYVRVGSRVKFIVDAIPNKTYSARITYLDPLIDPQTRTTTARAEISNSSGKLKPEMFVKANITINPALASKQGMKGGVLVPKTSVLWTGEQSVVYVQVPDKEIPTYEYREVTIGSPVGQYYAVIDGLDLGEEVVTNGVFRIDAAAQLSNKQSMMNKQVSVKGAPEKSEENIPDFTRATPKKFREQLMQLKDKYLQLKDALVATDHEKTKMATLEAVKTLDKLDMPSLKGEAHSFWMKQMNAMESHGKQMNEAEDIEQKRHQFIFYSDALISTLKAFGVDNTLYVQHCPMANDGKGANWISDKEEVRNPYFGDKMLKCGFVKTTISK